MYTAEISTVCLSITLKSTVFVTNYLVKNIILNWQLVNSQINSEKSSLILPFLEAFCCQLSLALWSFHSEKIVEKELKKLRSCPEKWKKENGKKRIWDVVQWIWLEDGKKVSYYKTYPCNWTAEIIYLHDIF